MRKLTSIVSTENRFQRCAVLAKSIRKVHKPNDQMQHTKRIVVEFMSQRLPPPLDGAKTPPQNAAPIREDSKKPAARAFPPVARFE
jgi:hypothetical protein